jgi:hypothetical protein
MNICLKYAMQQMRKDFNISKKNWMYGYILTINREEDIVKYAIALSLDYNTVVQIVCQYGMLVSTTAIFPTIEKCEACTDALILKSIQRRMI